jgi:hypothetical protein
MSLAAIQDNLVKTSLVQHTQTQGDGVVRGQEIANVTIQRELDRQEDQVVISLRQKEEHGIRPDEDREKERGGKKHGKGGKNSQNDPDGPTDGDESAEPGTREVMRRINIVI